MLAVDAGAVYILDRVLLFILGEGKLNIQMWNHAKPSTVRLPNTFQVRTVFYATITKLLVDRGKNWKITWNWQSDYLMKDLLILLEQRKWKKEDV